MFWNDSVDSVLKAFTLLIGRLEAIAKARQQKARELDREVTRVSGLRTAAEAESQRAQRVASKLKELLA